MQELFKLRETNRNVRNKYKLNLNIPVVNQVNYGFGPKIFNSLPHHVKSAENLEAVKKIINNWIGVCSSCCLLFVVWKTFLKNLLVVYYISAFLFIVIFTNIYIYINISPPGLSRF